MYVWVPMFICSCELCPFFECYLLVAASCGIFISSESLLDGCCCCPCPCFCFFYLVYLVVVCMCVRVSVCLELVCLSLCSLVLVSPVSILFCLDGPHYI